MNCYRELLSGLSYRPLYCTPWWLEAAVGQVSRLGVLTAGSPEDPVAALPIFEPVHGVVTVPPFCQYTGPVGAELPIGASFVRRTSGAAQEAHREIIRQLGAYHAWEVHLLPGQEDWLPYKEAGARAVPYMTHRLSLSRGTERVRAGYNQLLRRKIRSFAVHNPHFSVEEGRAEDLIRLSAGVIRRTGRSRFYQLSLNRLIQAAVSRDQGFVLAVYASGAAAPAADMPLAVLFMAWEQDVAYYIAGARDEKNPLAADALAFLTDEALARCAARGIREVDFEGSMVPGVAFFYRSLGGLPVSYLRISRGALTPIQRLKRKLYYKKYIL